MVFYDILWSIQTKLKKNDSLDCPFVDQETLTKDFPSEEAFPESSRPYLSKFADMMRAYQEIDTFVQEVEDSCYNSAQPAPLYLTGFCEGLKTIINDLYSILYEIEKMAVPDKDFSVISAAVMLDPITSALLAVVEGIKIIKTKSEDDQHIGCQILDLCLTFIHSCTQDGQQAYKTIFKHCLKPFYMQTKQWMLYSKLLDPYNEYFITQLQANDATEATKMSVNSTMKDFTSRKYDIMPDKLPTFVPYSIATKMLFIGETLTLFKREYDDFHSRDDKILEQCGLDEKHLLSKFAELEKNDFNIAGLDSLTTEIWINVDRYARKLSEEIADIRGQIILMSDIYLLGRGELFQEFIQESKSVLGAQPTSIAVNNLRSYFRNSVHKVYLTDNSELLKSIDFTTIPIKPNKNIKIWDVVRIDIKIRWPLQSIFTPQVIQTYNILFRFLLKLRKAQMDLLDTWKREDSLDFIILRNHLMAIVSNLQNYCFTNVIAMETDILITTFDSTDTLSDVQKALALFQENLLQQLFHSDQELETFVEDAPDFRSKLEQSTTKGVVETPTLNREIRKFFKLIFKICHRFSEMDESQSESQISFIRIYSTKLDQALNTLMNFSKAMDKNYASSNLQNLIMNLDYNHFFSEKYRNSED